MRRWRKPIPCGNRGAWFLLYSLYKEGISLGIRRQSIFYREYQKIRKSLAEVRRTPLLIKFFERIEGRRFCVSLTTLKTGTLALLVRSTTYSLPGKPYIISNIVKPSLLFPLLLMALRLLEKLLSLSTRFLWLKNLFRIKPKNAYSWINSRLRFSR